MCVCVCARARACGCSSQSARTHRVFALSAVATVLRAASAVQVAASWTWPGLFGAAVRQKFLLTPRGAYGERVLRRSLLQTQRTMNRSDDIAAQVSPSGGGNVVIDERWQYYSTYATKGTTQVLCAVEQFFSACVRCWVTKQAQAVRTSETEKVVFDEYLAELHVPGAWVRVVEGLCGIM